MSKTILCADDSVTMQTVAEITFRATDYEYVGARSADEALQKAKANKPALILADAVMPGKTGYDLCMAVKADPALADVPVVIMCGNSQAYDAAKGGKVGADSSVTKPWDTQVMLEKISEILEKSVTDGVARPAGAGAAAASPAAASPPTIPSSIPPRPAPPPPAPNPAAPRAATIMGMPTIKMPPARQTPGVSSVPATPPRPVVPTPPAAPPRPAAAPTPATAPPRPAAAPLRPAAPTPAAAPPRPAAAPTPPAAPPRPAAAPTPAPAPVAAARPAVAARAPAPAAQSAGGLSRPPMIRGVPTRRPTDGGAAAGARQAAAAFAPSPAVPRARPDEETSPATIAARAASQVPVAAAAVARDAGLDPSGPEMAALLALSRDVVERVVWEVVPELAEAIIRENIDRLAAKMR